MSDFFFVLLCFLSSPNGACITFVVRKRSLNVGSDSSPEVPSGFAVPHPKEMLQRWCERRVLGAAAPPRRCRPCCRHTGLLSRDETAADLSSGRTPCNSPSTGEHVGTGVGGGGCCHVPPSEARVGQRLIIPSPRSGYICRLQNSSVAA